MGPKLLQRCSRRNFHGKCSIFSHSLAWNACHWTKSVTKLCYSTKFEHIDRNKTFKERKHTHTHAHGFVSRKCKSLEIWETYYDYTLFDEFGTWCQTIAAAFLFSFTHEFLDEYNYSIVVTANCSLWRKKQQNITYYNVSKYHYHYYCYEFFLL